MAMSLNQYSNGEAFWRGCEERIWHDVDAAGNCRIPWCTFSTEIEGSEHINLDRVLNEPGRFNLFKNHETQAGVLSREHRKAMNELGTIVKFIHDTFPLRANAIDPTGEMKTANLTIAVMGQLRRDLLHATADRDVWMTSTNEPSFIPDDEKTSSSCKHEGADAEPMCNLKRHEGDTMQPHARRERTLNELHTLLHNMLFSGIDVAVRGLQEYLARHVTAADALIRTSMQLEGFSEECCIGCEEHGSKNKDSKYDRPDGLRGRKPTGQH